MRKEKHSLSVCIWFQDSQNCALCHHALGAHVPTSRSATISQFPCNFFPEWPLNFFGLHDSPSNLAESRYPRYQTANSFRTWSYFITLSKCKEKNTKLTNNAEKCRFGLLKKAVAARVPGLGQITSRIVLTKKMRGHKGENFGQKSRIRHSGGSGSSRTVDAECKCAPS